jgi:hypothetical protein
MNEPDAYHEYRISAHYLRALITGSEWDLLAPEREALEFFKARALGRAAACGFFTSEWRPAASVTRALAHCAVSGNLAATQTIRLGVWK